MLKSEQGQLEIAVPRERQGESVAGKYVCGESVFQKAQVQTCIVPMIRASVNYASWKERKALAADLKPIYRAVNAEAAAVALEDFCERWPKHQVVADVWQR